MISILLLTIVLLTNVVKTIAEELKASLIAIRHFSLSLSTIVCVIFSRKLLIVFIIQIISFDRLISYATLIVAVLLVDCCIYVAYCNKFFPESRRITFRKTPILNEMLSFAGWALIGNLAYIGYTQGLNVLLNMFYGPVVNASRAVAVQAQNAVKSFVSSFQTAANPQITKSYANGDIYRLHRLIFTCSKMSYYLMFCLALPIIIKTEYIMSIWLKEVPEHAVSFLRLVLIISLIEPLYNPIDTANNATGKIRNYQIIEGGILLLICPVSYILMKIGCIPELVFVTQFIISFIAQIVRVFIVKDKLKLSPTTYCIKILLPIFKVTLLSTIISVCLLRYLDNYNSFLSLLVTFSICILTIFTIAFFIGIDTSEQKFIKQKIENFRLRLANR